MAELRSHDRPDQPEQPETHDVPHSRGRAEIQRILDMQKGPEKVDRPTRGSVPAAIKEILDMQNPPQRGLIYSTPDRRQHSPDKPPQKHPDITEHYGPMSEIAKEPQDRISSSDRRSRAARAVDAMTDNAEDVANDVQATVDTIMRTIDDRPAAHQTGTGMRQPDRPTYNPAAKDAPHDVISNVTITTIFVAELSRRIFTKGTEAMTHRRQDTA